METRERVKEILKELIRIKSVSGMEESIQRYIEDRLKAKGIKLRKQYVDGKRYNLFYKGKSPYLISCHVDTVPPIDMKNAFKPKEVGNRIYGRGASDVKGALSALITAMEIFKERYPDKEIPVSVAFVVDEENNSALGSEKVTELMENERYCLILEPTYGLLCTSQHGALEFSITVTGESVHGAEFEKTENPVKVCLKLIELIENKLSRSVNVIMIKGGSKHYIVPRKCYALMEVKIFKGESWQDTEQTIKKAIKELNTSCKIEYRLEDAEDFLSFRCEGFAEMLEDVYREAVGDSIKRGTMPSWTDAANYHKAGYSCVIFGHGSLKDSHTDRESISVDDLEKMTMFFLKLFERVG